MQSIEEEKYLKRSKEKSVIKVVVIVGMKKYAQKRKEKMKETTVLNNISKLVEKINYKSIYIEINTKDNKWVLEKDSNKPIGFRK